MEETLYVLSVEQKLEVRNAQFNRGLAIEQANAQVQKSNNDYIEVINKMAKDLNIPNTHEFNEVTLEVTAKK